MTHRDEINNMSNEELAKLLGNWSCDYCAKTYDTNMCGEYDRCTQGIIEWLNMEVEE